MSAAAASKGLVGRLHSTHGVWTSVLRPGRSRSALQLVALVILSLAKASRDPCN